MTTTPVVTGGTVPPAAASPAAKETAPKAQGKRSKRHSPEQIVAKLRDAAAMLNAGKDLAVVIQTLEVSEATYHRWIAQYGGMKSEETKQPSSPGGNSSSGRDAETGHLSTGSRRAALGGGVRVKVRDRSAD